MEQVLHQVAETVERQLDNEIERLDALDSNDLEVLRQQRLADMKKRAQQQRDWRAKGHGEYTELDREKDFFAACSASERVVCHFFRPGAPRCDILHMHLARLAPKHVETRFLKLNVERAPFLAERLKVRVLPTLALVVANQTRGFVVGFTELGNRDDFTTDMLEWRLARSEVIEYSGDLSSPPAPGPRGALSLRPKGAIRGGPDSDSDGLSD